MEEKQLSGEDSLRLVNRMIYEARGYFYESGTGALLLGFGVLICSVLSALAEKNIINFPFKPFYLMIPIFAVQGFIQYKEEKKKKAKTFTDETIDFIWLAFFISVVISLAGIFGGAGYSIITIILFLSGFAAFLTGMVAKFRYHIACGIVVLFLAAASFFIRNENIYFLLAATSVGIWIIPGFILRAYFKQQVHGK